MDFTKLANYIDDLNHRYGIPACDIKVMKEHETVFRHMSGYADHEKTIPLTEKNLYRLFSATKLVTMTAVMQLIEAGKLQFHDEVRHYLPEFDLMKVVDEFSLEQPFHWPRSTQPCHYAHHAIRIIDLMTMTSGMTYDLDFPEENAVRKADPQASTREVIRELAKMPLCWEPGTRFAYSLAHDVLGAVVEVVSGMRFSEYLKKYIFEPLGITDLYFHWEDHKGTAERICALYKWLDDGSVVPDDGREMALFKFTKNYESGGAGLAGSVDAYSIFLDAIANGGVGANGARILSEQTVRKFTVPYTTGMMSEDFARLRRVGYEYGLGVRVLVDQTKSRSPVGEFGWDGALGAYVLADLKNKISIFYVQHISNFQIVYEEIHPRLRDLSYEALGL